MEPTRRIIVVVGAVLASTWGAVIVADGAADAPSSNVRTQTFDADPKWDGHNNRIGAAREPLPVRQAFGYSRTAHAGGASAGEVGGFVSPAAEPAFYGGALPAGLSLETPLAASGKLMVPRGGGNVLVGFFNHATVNEWRTPNTLVMRVNARGDEGFHAHVEYCTSRWRAGADFFGAVDPATGKKLAKLFAPGVSHAWSVRYDPPATTAAARSARRWTATNWSSTSTRPTSPTGRRLTASESSTSSRATTEAARSGWTTSTSTMSATRSTPTRSGTASTTDGRTRRGTSARGSTSAFQARITLAAPPRAR